MLELNLITLLFSSFILNLCFKLIKILQRFNFKVIYKPVNKLNFPSTIPCNKFGITFKKNKVILYLTACRNGCAKPNEVKTYLIERRRPEVQIKHTNKSDKAI